MTSRGYCAVHRQAELGRAMLKIVSNSWALFLGLAFIMLGNGLQGSLLGLRASLEGFSITATGLIMSGYFIGMISGSILVPKLVARVGHVRTFGALASLASTAILIHLVFIVPWVWWTMRITTGFAYAGLYIVAESWLNDAATNETRGQLLSFYMLISLVGMAGGQLMLNLSSPGGFTLFILVSALVSIAVIPILVSVSKAPEFEAIESVSVRQLFTVSPLGVFGIFASGMNAGTIFGIGTVYASAIGLSVAKVSFFMSSIVIGGALLQYPIGWLSDRIGRRKIIIATSALGALSYLAMTLVPVGEWWFYGLMALAGGLSLPLYSLCIAHTNDYLSQSQMVAASSTLVLANGLGAAVGAPATAFLMDVVGPQGFFQGNAIALASIFLFAIWRSARRTAITPDEQGDFVPLTPSPINAAFNPELELEEIEAAGDVDRSAVEASFDELVKELDQRDESDQGQEGDQEGSSGEPNKSDQKIEDGEKVKSD